MNSSYDPTRATAGHAATAAPTGLWPSPCATFAASVAAMPRPGSRRASAGTRASRRAESSCRSHLPIERTFTSVREALPPSSIEAFDAELRRITQSPVVDLGALDDFLSGWWRIATRTAADPADWQRMHQEADQLQSGTRPPGPSLAEVLGRRGLHL